MNYNYLRIFYTVAKLQNISKAAEQLDVTQPAVSRIISSIEKEYKVKLFSRSKNGVKLTPEGQKLFEMIKSPCNELERIDESITNGELFKDSFIHIGATTTALYCFLFKILEKIKDRFPSINFRIYSDSSANLLKMVTDGAVDFAFITTPFKRNDEIVIDSFYKLNNVLIAPISYKDKIKGPVTIKSLTKYPFILLNKEMQFREYINEFLKQHNAVIHPAYETDSSSELLPFVKNDYGLTFIPEEMAEEAIKEGKCFKVDLIEKMPVRYISCIAKKERNKSSVIYEIMDAILRLK